MNDPNGSPTPAVHPGGLAQATPELQQARRWQLALDAPYQEANNRLLGITSAVLYTRPHGLEVVAAMVVKLLGDGAPVLRVFGAEPQQDSTLWSTHFTVARPGTPEAAGCWGWAHSGVPQCPCGAGCVLFSTGRCTACDKSPAELAQSTWVDSGVSP